MRINAFTDVCLRVAMLLAAAPDGTLLTSRVIADGVGTPYSHVSKAIIRLRGLQIVEVVRGRFGGVRISAAGRRTTVGWLMRQLDTRADVADCETPHGDCPLSGGCGLRAALRRAREAFYSELDNTTIASLVPRRGTGSVALTLTTMIGNTP
ncbi:Rrf2 family transcriptional regulator [Cryobacterium algoritolerans]|uniref:Rrf2 family transcriptional regulator n=1 Tax=Cryobacterium algoritolerans TaxID=1259184 RepID=A0A4R8WMY1_9MICO|nr:Rrf2 family transcriptional regulator [Cryobacterium algoritolerans]TFC09891.1 Rrf2 family transcriptional regulator [Cryobacterium algoritolerans]